MGGITDHDRVAAVPPTCRHKLNCVGAAGEVPDLHRVVPASGDGDHTAVQIGASHRGHRGGGSMSGTPIEVLVTRSQTRTVPSTPPVAATARPSRFVAGSVSGRLEKRSEESNAPCTCAAQGSELSDHRRARWPAPRTRSLRTSRTWVPAGSPNRAVRTRYLSALLVLCCGGTADESCRDAEAEDERSMAWRSQGRSCPHLTTPQTPVRPEP
jgi:hypothetical protein